MRNLLLYGTTDYGPNLNSSDNLKFNELSKNFKTYVITFGQENNYINHDYNIFDKLLIFYLMHHNCLIFV